MPGTEEEARRLVDVAREHGVHLRIIGGLAVKLHCPNAEHRALTRVYSDLDCVGYRSQRVEIGRVLESLGYEPDRRFNALQGHRRLLYSHPAQGIDLDVFLDVFPMCHALSFVGRLEHDTYTVPLAELLLSKLQVVQLNEKDVKDVYALVYDHELAESDDRETIDTRAILRICSDDWGWYRTVTGNIGKVLGIAGEYLEAEKKDIITSRLQALRQLIERAPKSTRWKARAIIGERQRWYEMPEEVQKKQDD